MFQFGQKHITVLCFVLLFATGMLLLWYPDFNFLEGGLISAIMVTLFIKKDIITQIVGAISIALIIVTTFLSANQLGNAEIVIQHIYSIILLTGTTVLVLYVKKLYRKVESDEGQLNALFQNATEGILLADTEGAIVLINPEANNIFGYQKDELLGTKIEKLIPLRYKSHHVHLRENFNDHPSSRRMGEGRDLYGLRKDGSEFPVEVSLSYFHQNKKFFVLAFVVDITLRKQSEDRLLQQRNALEKMAHDMKVLNAGLEEEVVKRTYHLTKTLEELEQSRQELRAALDKEKELNEIKSRFVSMASHEFRTPLSTILSSASLTGKYTEEAQQPQRDRHIGKIKDAVKHLNNLLEDFLSLGKLEEGKVEAKPEKFNVNELLEDVNEEIKPLLKDHQQIDIHRNGVAVFNSDRLLIKSILYNLLTNASKFSSGEAVIAVKVKIEDHRLFMEVADRGVGIPEQDKNHLFSSFFRASNVLNIQGTGLGLHIVKRYVDLLNGNIELESELNKGTTVRITLPELN